MKATPPWAGALFGTLLAANSLLANHWFYPSYPYQGFRTYNGPFPYPGYRVVPGPIPTAPDMTGPGFYTNCPHHGWYGPNHCVTPPFPPFQGMLPGKQGQQIAAGKHACFNPPPGAAAAAGYAPYARNYGVISPPPSPGGYPGSTGYPSSNGSPAAPGYPGSSGQAGPSNAAFPTHPYMRSPRDFFMWRENQEEQTARGSRPSLVP